MFESAHRFLNKNSGLVRAGQGPWSVPKKCPQTQQGSAPSVCCMGCQVQSLTRTRWWRLHKVAKWPLHVMVYGWVSQSVCGCDQRKLEKKGFCFSLQATIKGSQDRSSRLEPQQRPYMEEQCFLASLLAHSGLGPLNQLPIRIMPTGQYEGGNPTAENTSS